MAGIDWVFERTRLATLIQYHPTWSTRRLAHACGHSLSWVKAWRKIIRDPRSTPEPLSRALSGHSRMPHRRAKVLLPFVRDAILSLRQDLREILQRTPGPKAILYYLHKDEALKQQAVAQGGYLPQSTRTIWQVLRDGGCLPQRVVEHHPLERAAPMTLWEMDFGQAGTGPEVMLVADQGTSIKVDSQCETHFNAESALRAIAETFLMNGLPDRLVFDRDPRLVSSWGMNGYPSPFMRFVASLGVIPAPTPPQRPDLKPIVERMIRTVKHEMLWIKRPPTPALAQPLLTAHRHFYNRERPNQLVVCGNRPPYSAFPVLPDRPEAPEQVDPDGWLRHFQDLVFRRQVNSQGIVSIDRHRYALGAGYAGQKVQLRLNGACRCLELIVNGQVAQDMPLKGLHGVTLEFQAYLRLMLKEARSLERLRHIKQALSKKIKQRR